MTAAEVCEKYGIKESTLKNNFQRTADAILKKHKVKLIKKGRGAKAVYIEVQDDERALTMFHENREVFFLDEESMNLAIWECNILLAIILCPMLVFRGSYLEMLDYVRVKPTAANLKSLKKTLQSLSDKGWIHYYIDETDNNYFVGALYRAIEQKYRGRN